MQSVGIGRIARSHYDGRRICSSSSVGTFSQPFYCFRQRELSSCKSTHKVSASHFSSELESSEFGVDRSPWNKRTLSPPPITRHNPISIQPLTSDCIDSLILSEIRS